MQPFATNDKSNGGGGPGPVQKKESGKDAGNPLKGQLRGMDFAAGEKLMAPGENVQMKGDPETDPAKSEVPPTVVDETKEKEGDNGDAKIVSAAQDLGYAESVDDGNSKIGNWIDAMTAVPGVGFSGSVEIKIPVGTGMFMMLKFEGSATRKKDKKAKREVALKTRVSFNLGTKKKYFELYVGLYAELGLKATGDTGGEIMRMFGYMLRARLSGIAPKACDRIWGKTQQEHAEEVAAGIEFDEKGNQLDTAEAYGSVGIHAGAKIKGPDGKGGKKELAGFKGEAGIKHSTELKVKKDEDKKDKTEVEKTTAKDGEVSDPKAAVAEAKTKREERKAKKEEKKEAKKAAEEANPLKLEEKTKLTFGTEAALKMGMGGKLKIEGDCELFRKDKTKPPKWNLKVGAELGIKTGDYGLDAVLTYLTSMVGTMAVAIAKSLKGKDEAAELEAVRMVQIMPVEVIGMHLVAAGMVKPGVGVDFKFKNGEFAGYSIYTYKDYGVDTDYMSAKLRQTTTIADEKVKTSDSKPKDDDKKAHASG